MSYINGILGAGEKISNAPGYHWVIYLKCIICGVVGAATLILLVGLPFLILSVVFFIHAYSLEVAITNQRLVSKRGWIARRTEERRWVG